MQYLPVRRQITPEALNQELERFLEASGCTSIAVFNCTPPEKRKIETSGYSLAPYFKVVADGEITVLMDGGQTYRAETGTVLLFHPNSWVACDLRKARTYLRFTLDLHTPVLGKCHWSGRNDSESRFLFHGQQRLPFIIEPLIDSLLNTHARNPHRARSEADLVMYAISDYLKCQDAQPPSSARTRYEMIEDYIRDNLHLDLTRDSVARAVGISANHVSKLYRQHARTSFIDSINDKRIELAGRLLQTTSQTVAEIAECVGFRDSNYFTRLFKRKMSKTPGQYRALAFGGRDVNSQ